MRIAFITSTPLGVGEGSGTFTGIYRLARALRRCGVDVELLAPAYRFPIHTVHRLWFNEQIADADFSRFDLTVGFDLDGFCLPKRRGPAHVASIKGVIADELRYERGATRWTMSMQAVCESIHASRASLVITTSRYSAQRIQDAYGPQAPVSIVPELIDLDRWRKRAASNAVERNSTRFTVLCVCRLYPRKRVGLLLEAAAQLRERIPQLEIQIVGDGPEGVSLQQRWLHLKLQETVRWMGKIDDTSLARAYQRADVFCLPSVQEGFGIVFLEAMAAGLPIVAARAAAIPEVVENALLAPPDDAGGIADAIERLYRDPALRARLSAEGFARVQQYDSPAVARLFLSRVESLMLR